MKYLLVAKPWKGGLAGYVYSALQELFPGQVEWLHTYPAGIRETIRYRRDRQAWKERLVSRITNKKYQAVIFINHAAEFRALPYSDNYILWLTDGPKLNSDDLRPYARVFLSDPGYEAEVKSIAKERYAGELAFAFLPSVHRPAAFAGARQGLCFIGNQDRKRDHFIAALLGAGLQPKIIGNYFLRHRLFWQRPLSFRPPIAIDRMAAVYARHLLSLNIHAEVVRQGTNMRTFECAGYGIPQLVEYRPGIEAYFEPDKEIVLFHSADELVEKAGRLLRDEKNLMAMAEQAQLRAQQCHTYQQRVRRLLDGVA